MIKCLVMSVGGGTALVGWRCELVNFCGSMKLIRVDDVVGRKGWMGFGDK